MYFFSILIYISFYFLFSFGGRFKGEGWIWEDWEMGGIGVHNLNFPKNQ